MREIPYQPSLQFSFLNLQILYKQKAEIITLCYFNMDIFSVRIRMLSHDSKYFTLHLSNPYSQYCFPDLWHVTIIQLLFLKYC